MADLTTFMPIRREPVGHVETFSTERASTRPATARIETEDAAGLLRPLRGRRPRRRHALPGQRRPQEPPQLGDQRLAGAAPPGAPSGRRSCGSAGATARASSMLRDPGQLAPYAAAHTRMPAGHSEGFAETFRELYRAVYTAVAAGEPPAAAGLPDLRRRPRAGADRRRDRALARGGPVGRSDALNAASSSTATARWSTPSRSPARRGAGSLAPVRLRDHRRGPRGLHRHARTRTPTPTSPSAPRSPDAPAVWPELSQRALRADRRAAARPSRTRSTAVEELRARGVPIAVASSSVRERLDRTLARAGLRFEITIAGDEVEHGKPSPGHVPARRAAAGARAGALRRGRGLAARASPPARRGDADARRLPRPGHRGDARAADRVVH